MAKTLEANICNIFDKSDVVCQKLVRENERQLIVRSIQIGRTERHIPIQQLTLLPEISRIVVIDSTETYSTAQTCRLESR